MSHRAHERSGLRREQASARLRLKDALIVSYALLSKLNWSPEIIAGTIKLEQPGLSISPEAIYQYIYQLTQRAVRSLSEVSRKGRTVSEGPKGIEQKARKPRCLTASIDDRLAAVEDRISSATGGDSLLSEKAARH